ncbi:MAG: 3-deoxy-D-manno-octulosonic acid transferase, partial [Pyrinomonadaceae bacterium]
MDVGLMYFLYSLLLTLGLVALSPLFLVAALRHGKYRSGLGERLGGVPPLVNTGRRPVIWLHCVSVGETQAARPLVQELLRRYPTHALAVSTTTLTGQRLARETFGKDAEAVFYFPLDFAWPVRRALTAIRPAAVLLMETELWPRFLRECSAGRVPVAIVNGRISEKSFRGYRRLGLLARYAVKDLSLALMQTDGDAERIEALGLAPARIHVSGNIKFDLETGAGDGQLTEELRARFGIDGRRPLIVAASTHAPEESICLDAFKLLNDTATGHTRPRLLLAPRHPERFNDVATLLDAAALNWSRRSVSPAETDQVSDIILL